MFQKNEIQLNFAKIPWASRENCIAKVKESMYLISTLWFQKRNKNSTFYYTSFLSFIIWSGHECTNGEAVVQEAELSLLSNTGSFSLWSLTGGTRDASTCHPISWRPHTSVFLLLVSAPEGFWTLFTMKKPTK